MQNCLLCREVAGEVFLPGGLHVGDEVVAFHLPEQPSGDVLLGHHLVVPKRHARDHGDLTDSEASEVGRFVQKYSRALRAEGAAHVYVFSVGHSHRHPHTHVVPRWTCIPESVGWQVKDEPGPHRIRTDEATSFAQRIRLQTR